MARLSPWNRLSGWMLDGSIVASFDASGFRRHSRDFKDPGIAVDLSGRVCLVTGANSGLGFSTSLELARRGAEVWLLCRNEARGQQAMAEISEQTGNPQLQLHLVDLSSLESIRRFAREMPDRPIHALVHNAGVLPSERMMTEDGLELCMATNLVGPFLMTALLWPRLAQADQPRIVHVSSGGMYSRKLNIHAIAGRQGTYDGVKAYADSKRGQVVLSEQLAEGLRAQGIAVHCMHPGWADTPGVRNSIPRFWKATKGILRSASQGADTITWLAATSLDLKESGQFWFDREARNTHLLPWTREDEGTRQDLWQAVMKWAGLDAEPDVWPMRN